MTKIERESAPVQIDIVSDVMCPWCVIGFRQLEQALGAIGTTAYIRWHPFELNPAMPEQGQNLRSHIAEKYGASAEQFAKNSAQLNQIGTNLGIDFRLGEDSRIVNTFAAHQLLDWAQMHALQHPLKLALFEAHFTKGRDVSKSDVLADIAAQVGLDPDAALGVLSSGSHATQTRARQQFWTERGISGVPAVVFDGKYLLTGAQGVQTYTEMLRKIMAEREEKTTV